jgi:hypothetical protein
VALSYAEEQAGLIEEIAPRPMMATKMGTVVSRNTGPTTDDAYGTGVQVKFDSSSGTGQPVHCFSSVLVAAGDRVGVVQYESDWIVTGNYTQRTLADQSTSVTFSSLTQTTSATYIDLPTSPTVIYEKMRDDTIMEFSAGVSGFGSNALNGMWLGLRITAADASVDYDENVRKFPLARPSVDYHFFWCGVVRAASAHPAMVYSATGRWYRYSGTGFVQVDSEDSVWIRCREVMA